MRSIYRTARLFIGAQIAAFAIAPAASDIEPTSANNEHLAKWLRKFPAADADRDGILTNTEVWVHLDVSLRERRAREVKLEQEAKQAREQGRPLPVGAVPRHRPPALADFRYGPHERNVFDFWPATSSRPTPLVVYIHGGAWKIGDKREIEPTTLEKFLAAGISVASLNYRYTTTTPLPAPHQDCARAVQVLRSKAREWNLDPERVGAYGGSAGAGITLWLALHDDLAAPSSADSIARQSTRLRCAATVAGQTTYDPHVIKAWIGEPAFRHSLFPTAYGVKSHAELADPRLQPIYDEMAPIKHLTRDDPPVLQIYSEPDMLVPPTAKNGQGMHHPVFGHKLKTAMDALGLECGYLHTVESDADPQQEIVSFFRRHFGLN